jgi:hypothetical protein
MSQARREARKRLTAAKAFMLNEWQRKRLIASGVVDRGFATLALLKTSAGSSPWKFRTPLWVAGITSEWWPASVRNGGRFQIGIPAGRRAYNRGIRAETGAACSTSALTPILFGFPLYRRCVRRAPRTILRILAL